MLAELRHLDPEAKLYSYLDDTYFVVDKRFAGQALRALETALCPLGLTLNQGKTVVWSPAGPEGLPAELLPYYAPALPLLGRHLTAGGDTDEAPMVRGRETTGGLAAATSRLSSLWAKLETLQKAGLAKQAVAALLRSYAGAASQYTLQLEHASNADTHLYDTALVHFWEELAGRTFDEHAKTRLGLPGQLGGCGAQFAAT